MKSNEVPLTKREQAMALKILGMLREECADDLICAVKALALANTLFQRAFASTVSHFAEKMVPLRGANTNEHDKR